jgi:metallo-beta-lactamase class B
MFVKALGVIAGGLALGACQTWSGGTSVILYHETAEEFAETCKPWDNWAKPAPSFYVDDDQVYATSYVGSCGITVLAVRTQKGVVLIDTGEEVFHDELLRNLHKFAIDPEDVTHILTSHEHYDHVGGLAAMQRATGAKIVTSPAAKPVIESGELAANDPQFGMHEAMVPANVWKTVKDGETITLGGKEFTAVHTPGHTPGALTWQWTTYVGQETLTIVYADSLSPISNTSYRFSDHPDYLQAYRNGLERLAALDCDILMTPHPSASFMLQRAPTGSMQNGMTCKEYADAVTRRLDNRLALEAERK